MVTVWENYGFVHSPLTCLSINWLLKGSNGALKLLMFRHTHTHTYYTPTSYPWLHCSWVMWETVVKAGSCYLSSERPLLQVRSVKQRCSFSHMTSSMFIHCAFVLVSFTGIRLHAINQILAKFDRCSASQTKMCCHRGNFIMYSVT